MRLSEKEERREYVGNLTNNGGGEVVERRLLSRAEEAQTQVDKTIVARR